MADRNSSLEIQNNAAAASASASDLPKQSSGSSSSSNNTKSNDPLLESIKQFVSITNSTLASFEEATYQTTSTFVSRLQQLGKQGRYIATRANTMYDQRGQYGALAVAGSAAVVGGMVALRMGRVPGVIAASLGGAAAYGNIYGYEDYSGTSWRRSVTKEKRS